MRRVVSTRRRVNVERSVLSQTQELKIRRGLCWQWSSFSLKKDTDKKKAQEYWETIWGDVKKSGKDGDESVGKVGGDSAIEAAAAAAISSATLTQDNTGAASASTATQNKLANMRRSTN